MSCEQADEAEEVPSVLKKLVKWGDYIATGTPVLPTRFVPCKTPLSKHILANWDLPAPPLHPLTVEQLLREQQVAGRTVGLILDLSNHDCLYAADIPATVQYRHIQLVAKELPHQGFVNLVQETANNFWVEHPHLYIAVHCAYGFNRTGFVVASYLIQQHGLSVDDALLAFCKSRPPGVKHAYFTDELRRRYEAHDHTRLLTGVGVTGPPEPGEEGEGVEEGEKAGAEADGDEGRQPSGGDVGQSLSEGPATSCSVARLANRNESLDLSLVQVDELQTMGRDLHFQHSAELSTPREAGIRLNLHVPLSASFGQCPDLTSPSQVAGRQLASMSVAGVISGAGSAGFGSRARVSGAMVRVSAEQVLVEEGEEQGDEEGRGHGGPASLREGTRGLMRVA